MGAKPSVRGRRMLYRYGIYITHRGAEEVGCFWWPRGTSLFIKHIFIHPYRYILPCLPGWDGGGRREARFFLPSSLLKMKILCFFRIVLLINYIDELYSKLLIVV